jgi:hypothetical protein
VEGALDGNYPLVYIHPRFTMHYQPHTYVGLHVDETVELIRAALEQVEQRLNVAFEDTFDVYAAGTFFANPNAALRGKSYSRDRQVFILHDGSGTDTECTYFFTHEITHLVAWNAWGTPSSRLLSEGVAAYTGQSILEREGYLTYREWCAAIHAAGMMPSMNTIEHDWSAFEGHIRNPYSTFGSGCFVGYLIDLYGLETVQQLYSTSDYTELTGKSLLELNDEWQATLAQLEPAIDAAALVALADEIGAAYDLIIANYGPTEGLLTAYTAIDEARTALWQGNLAGARLRLDAAYAVLGER